MKFNRRLWLIAFAAAFTARADLSRWIQDLASPNKLQAVFFRSVPMPGGPIDMRRAPRETRSELAKLIVASPSDGSLYALRAREDELQLDFTGAEEDWKKSGDASALADFYHRRIRPMQEIAALESVGRTSASNDEKSLPAIQQRAWKAFERIQDVVTRQSLPVSASAAGYRAWVARYPVEPIAYQRFFNAMADKKQFAEAEQVLSEYRRTFPTDEIYPVQAAAVLAARRGGPDDALLVYGAAFRPLWPAELVKAYFDQLKQAHALRRFLEQARASVAANPTSLDPAARIFYYHQQAGSPAAASRALLEFRQRKTTAKSVWTTDELWTLGQLFEAVHNYDDAARSYYSLYAIGAGEQERALAALADLLLTAPDQPIRIGAGNLSTYRDVAAVDSGPGFLNGILSLLFNSTNPADQYGTEDQASASYFHRVAAADLIARFDSRFPNSPRRPGLQAELLGTYVIYGDDAGVLKAGSDFLRLFPRSSERVDVALHMADAYARQNKQREEFAIYDGLLRELGAGGPGYSGVFDRYLARLASMKRVNEALSLYRREIDRNPNEPALYEKLAGFLQQNKLDAQIEPVYRKAITQFPDKSWSHKLARFYLRRKQMVEFDALTRDVAGIFSGSELESYLADVGQSQALGAALYKQVNLYAHRRFPNNVAFVRNLLDAYQAKGTADPAAREALLRATWSYSPDLRDRFFEFLSRTGKLKSELASLARPNAGTNPVAARFAAEAEAWQSHFETAAPLFRAVSAEYPGDAAEQIRAASLFRSLATYDGPGDFKNTEIAAQIQLNAANAAPLDESAWSLVGEIYADRERFGKAGPYWNRIASVEPGSPDGYVTAATVFWDYYRFDDALRHIADGRRKLSTPYLFAHEAGAIAENRREYDRALREYAQGAIEGGDTASRERLVALSKRPAQRQAVEQLTLKAASGPNSPLAAVSLRADILAAQDRFDDLSVFLTEVAKASSLADVLQFIDDTAATRGLEMPREQAKLRTVTLATDPVERMQLSLDLLHFYEAQKNAPAARRIIDDLYRANPTILGVIRASVDYTWRIGDTKRAVDLLTEAAAKAQPSYRDPFLLEAARKATASADYIRARTLLTGLLAKQPLRSDYVAAMADTYARQSDDKGLRDFYSDRLKAAGKTDKAAELRRGLIPVLARLRDFSGALDQYIEILNRFPEDAGLTQEAAIFAASNGQAARLIKYYQDTQSQSPKDYRWPLVEARMQVHLEDFPAAISAYRRASVLRPDRVEFYSERAGLEERLFRFDDAASAYQRIYELTYHNSQWMDRVAQVRARQGRVDEAVKSLTVAYLDGLPARPEGYFTVARRLEGWNLLTKAKQFSAKGVDLAGADVGRDYPDGARTYMRVMTRLREYDAAFRKLGPIALEDMGLTVHDYFTPEEKSAFVTFVGARLDVFQPAIQASGIAELQARAAGSDMKVLVSIQQRRLLFSQVAGQLEAYWKSLPPEAENRDSYLTMAADNYRLAGNSADESRILAMRLQQGALDDTSLDRAALLIARSNDWANILGSVRTREQLRDRVAGSIVAAGPADKALRAMTARGLGLEPIWTRAYLALAGLFYRIDTPAVSAAFTQLLGAPTIGGRLAKPPAPAATKASALVGDIWYYYGSRYGEYLDAIRQPGSEDYLPASLEARSSSADAYLKLGEYYQSGGLLEKAREEYSRAIDLAPNRIDVHNRLASLALAQGNVNEALVEFRAALSAASRIQDSTRIPNEFWAELQVTVESLENAKRVETLRPELERLLKTYVRRNGHFRLEQILPHLGVPWVLQLSTVAPEPVQFLAAEVNSEWVGDAGRPSLYDGLLRAASKKPEMAQDLRKYQLEYIRYLLAGKHAPEARRILSQVTAVSAKDNELIPFEIVIESQTGGLTALLTRFESDPELLDKLDALRNGATELESAGDSAAARQVLELVYTRQLRAGQKDRALFLGLAEIRLEQGDASAAITLLRRMTLLSGEPFDSLRSAADLLSRKGRTREATVFLQQRIAAVPWDSDARLELARLSGTAEVAKSIAVSADESYQLRIASAKLLRAMKAPSVTGTSGELSLISGVTIAPSFAEKPFFYDGRLEAAQQTKDPSTRVRLLLGAIAIAPLSEKPKRDLILAAVDAKQWQLAVSIPFSGELEPTHYRSLGVAYEALGELQSAEDSYRRAKSSPDLRRVAEARRLLEVNAARMPLVTKNLEQDHLVRPKLTSVNGGIR